LIEKMRGEEGSFLVRTGASLTHSPPLGLMILSTILKEGGFRAELFVLSVRPEKREALLDQCRRQPPL
jgi:hypothetical protein